MKKDPEGELVEQECWNTDGWFQKWGLDIQKGRLKINSIKAAELEVWRKL